MDFFKISITFFGSLLAGFVGGQVGGGGLLTLPILLLIGLHPLVALGTNRFAAVFLNLISAITFYRQKKISAKNYWIFGGIALAGGIFGSLIINNVSIDSIVLKKLITIVLLLLAFVLFFKKNLGLTETELKLSYKHYFLLLVLIFIVSIYGGILGVAMTTFFAMLFTLNRQSFIQAMSYALFLSFIVSISSTITFMFHSQVEYFYATLQAIGGALGAYFGSKYAIKKGNLWIKNLTFLIVLVLLIKLLLEVF